MQEDFDHFGIPRENIRAAEKWAAKHRKRYRYHTRVPTRKEVLGLPPEELTSVLVGWMVHSPPEIIPSGFQVELVLELLEQRGDAEKLSSLVKMCRHFAAGH